MYRLAKITAALALGLFIANAGTEAKAQWGGGPGHGPGHGGGRGPGHGDGRGHHGDGRGHHGGGWGHYGGGWGHHGGGWGRGEVGPGFPPVVARRPIPAAYLGYPVGRVIYYGGVNYRILPFGVMAPY